MLRATCGEGWDRDGGELIKCETVVDWMVAGAAACLVLTVRDEPLEHDALAPTPTVNRQRVATGRQHSRLRVKLFEQRTRPVF